MLRLDLFLLHTRDIAHKETSNPFYFSAREILIGKELLDNSTMFDFEEYKQFMTTFNSSGIMNFTMRPCSLSEELNDVSNHDKSTNSFGLRLPNYID
jgi:hypothetical protein